MAAALGNHTKGRSGTSSVTGDATISTPAGATVYAGLSFDAAASVSGSIVDVAGNTLSLVGSTQTGNGNKEALYVCENAPFGSAVNNVIVNFSAAAFPSLFFGALLNVAAASLENSSVTTGTGFPYTASTGVMSQADMIILYMLGTSTGVNPSTFTFGNGFAKIDEETDASQYWTGAIGYLVVASTASVTASATHNDTGGMTVNKTLAWFKGAGAAATSNPPLKAFPRSVLMF